MWRLARPIQLLADLILPDGCGACDRFLATGDGPWCPDCALQLGRATAAPYCPRCGLTGTEPASLADGCHRCREQPILFDGMARVGEYDGRLAEIIRAYKFARRQRLDRPLGVLLAAAITRQPWASELDALVPVPTSWRSWRRYSFSPPASLAHQVSRELGLPALPLLRERGKAHRQVGLTLPERVKNVRGRYHLRPGAKPAGSILCIVDDVSTSGSTLQEVARTLKTAGATRVYAAVLGRTNGNLDSPDF
ncbi:MAG: ComF family protein [Planctomycetes bacterium]|nr:ComF family protein [Planctomycetota bacterium]